VSESQDLREFIREQSLLAENKMQRASLIQILDQLKDGGTASA
jgi:hypothetical protein